MANLGLRFSIKNFLLACLFLFPLTCNASFIESTVGAAVVNDATATYYNPAALTLLKKPQIVGLGSVANLHTEFRGQAIQTNTGFTQSGTSTTQTHYYLPSFYVGVPAPNKITAGLAVLSNDFNRDGQEDSILRYAQSNNHVQNIDVVPAIGIKLNEYFALGAGLNVSYAHFLLQPITGFPSLNIPDSQSRNDIKATSLGGDVGWLLKPTQSTLIGFNYRSKITYQLNGESIFEGHPKMISTNYHFTFWTPARSVLSINQFVTSNLGLIGTLQYLEWNVFNHINIFNIATQRGIISKATVPYHLHNSWVVTLGSHYRITPKWIIRVAGSYIESPASGNFQISNGDNIVLGASMGYEINKTITIDGSFAHAFIIDKNIHITAGRNIINGVNKAFRDAVSLKLTFNIL